MYKIMVIANGKLSFDLPPQLLFLKCTPASRKDAQTVLLLLNGRMASSSLRISHSSPSRWSSKIRLSNEHTIVSLSLNADEMLVLSTYV